MDIADLAEMREQQERDMVLMSIPSYVGESASECDECGNDIPAARRRAIPGVCLCVHCQDKKERRLRLAS